MTKDRLIFGLLGVLIGAFGGFYAANTINRNAARTAAISAAPSAASITNSDLPLEHPPLTGTSGESKPVGALPQVTAALDAAKSEPQNFQAQMEAGDLYYKIKRFDEAAEFYEKAAKLKPGDEVPVVKMGNARFDAEKYTEAADNYEQALKIKPDDIRVRTDLGLTFFLRKPQDIDRAIKEYQASLAIDPNHEITLQNLLAAYSQKGDSPNARATYERLKAVNPNNKAAIDFARSN